jgi:hypothetical protein
MEEGGDMRGGPKTNRHLPVLLMQEKASQSVPGQPASTRKPANSTRKQSACLMKRTPSPNHLEATEEGLIPRKDAPHSAAAARASNVLPVPTGRTRAQAAASHSLHTIQACLPAVHPP